VSKIVSDNAWKISIVVFSVKNVHNTQGSIACASWLLGQSGVLLERPGDAMFELQIVDVPHGLADLTDGDGPLFEVQDRAYIMQGLLAYD
jgi:hypothetical protein